jgi:hypothetical protein
MKVTRIMWYAGTIFTTLAMLAGSVNLAAQERADRHRAGNLQAFRGIARKLNTTPDALQSSFERARLTNPRLSRGNFIAANVLADNLGARRPNVTTAAILSGLQDGKSIGQTLQSLGLSQAEAKEARRAANLRVKDGEQRVKDEDRRERARGGEGKQRDREDAGRNR